MDLAIEHQDGDPPVPPVRQRRSEGSETGTAIVRSEGTRPVDDHHDPGAAGNHGELRRRVEPVVVQHAIRTEGHDRESAVDLADRRAAGQDDLSVGRFGDGARVRLAGQRLLDPRTLVQRRPHDAPVGHGDAIDQHPASRHRGANDQLGDHRARQPQDVAPVQVSRRKLQGVLDGLFLARRNREDLECQMTLLAPREQRRILRVIAPDAGQLLVAARRLFRFQQVAAKPDRPALAKTQRA